MSRTVSFNFWTLNNPALSAVPNGSNSGLVLNSSSGVSSGSTGSSSGEENNKPDSPTPSSSTVVNKSGAAAAAAGADKADVVKPRPRHLKPRASKANSGELERTGK